MRCNQCGRRFDPDEGDCPCGRSQEPEEEKEVPVYDLSKGCEILVWLRWAKDTAAYYYRLGLLNLRFQCRILPRKLVIIFLKVVCAMPCIPYLTPRHHKRAESKNEKTYGYNCIHIHVSPT
jgi:hypothetical protein